jgi:hypothetical protein
MNAYFAALLITIAGAGASLIIIHVAYLNTFTIVTSTIGITQASGSTR